MRVQVIAALVLLTGSLSGQAPPEERIYQAIRTNDLAALRVLSARDVNARDALAQTPLMLASAFGSTQAVRALLAAGADARAVSPSGATALHWAVTDLDKARALVAAGADVNAVSQLGRTPLLVASSAHGTAGVVRLLLSKGAHVNAADAVGVTPLIAALSVDNRDAAALLLAAGADVNALARVGQSATPLIAAANHGNVDGIKTLLARKVNVSAVSADRAGIVKNGAVLFGNVTALHMAVSNGDLEPVRLLLDAGSEPDAQDVRGMTPLVWSVSTDRPNVRIVKLLLARHANPAVETKDGEDAKAWARKFNNPPVLAALGLKQTPVPDGASVRPVADASPREAVARSLPLLQLASGRMMTGGGCAACHAQPLSAMSIDLARARGWTESDADVDLQQVMAFFGANTQPMLQLRDGGGQPDTQGYLTLAMAAHEVPASRATDALAHYLAAKQRPDGSWRGVGATRAPIQNGDFSRTALSLRALSVYPIPSRAVELRERVGRAAAWLATQPPLSTEDRAMQLLGLQWASAWREVRESRTRELKALQRPDGGWGQTPFLASDAYATGQVLYTLRQLSVPAADAALQRGVAFLTRTQRADGSWYVKSRAMKIQPYFESGFPHGHDQWISQAGTSWAAMGLALAAPDRPTTSARR